MLKLKKLPFLIFLILFFLAFSFQGNLKNLCFLVFSPFQKFFWNLGSKISNFFSFFAEISRLKSEKEKLEKENLKLKAQIGKFFEIEKENEILREKLNLKKEKIEVIGAKIVAKDPAKDIILIDKGKKDGVFEGQVAISPQRALLGKVFKVYSSFSKVALISLENFNFNSQIPSKNIEALAEGKGNLNLSLKFLPKESKIEVGDLVFTSALGGKFPPGIFVGEIEKIENFPTKPYSESKIKLGFSLSDLNFIFLIKNFEPWKES